MMTGNNQPRSLLSRMLREVASLSRFGLVGIVATTIYYGVAQAANWAGLAPFAANLVAYLSGASFSFAGHFRFTFRRSGQAMRHLMRYSVVSIAGYILSYLIVSLAIGSFGAPFWLATLIVALTVPFASWTASRFWAFA